MQPGRADGAAVRRRLRLPGGEAGEPPRERAPDPGDQEVVHRPGLAEPHFALARMHIDVHQGRVHGEEQHRDRIASGGEPPLEGDAHRVSERPVAYPPTVQEEVLAAGGPRPDPSPEVQAVRRRLDRRRGGGEPAADRLVEPARFAAGSKCGASVVPQPERDVRAGEGEAAHRIDRVLELGTLRSQEPPPGRNVVEKVLDVHRGSPRVAGRLRVASVSPNPPAGRFARDPRGKGQPRNRRDARERLTPEAEARDAEEIVDRGDLARRMTFEREGEVPAPDPAPVVGDPNPPGAARLEVDRHRARPRVQAVLDELLDHRRRALDHLPGRELARDLRRQARDRRRERRRRRASATAVAGEIPAVRAVRRGHPALLRAPRSRVATVSTWEVWGNMSASASARSR